MKKFILFILIPFLSACGSKNPNLQGPTEKMQALTIEAERSSTASDPKVNILFVVDNSGSMKGYQDKLVSNMKLFSDRFFAHSRIDYKIGVVPIYDAKYLDGEIVNSSGPRKMNRLGELVLLKGLAADENQGQVFITRNTKNPKLVLEKTVAIGTQWGPEAEESFSPVLAIADDKINTEKNQGFYEKDAYLAVIFLTDADDVTFGLSGEAFYDKLLILKDGDEQKVLIAAALPNIENKSATCTKDGLGPVQAFPDLLAKSGGIYADLCSKNFGSKLAEFAEKLVQRVAYQRISVGFKPDITTLQVSYGLPDSNPSERIEILRAKNGYSYDAEKDQVVIGQDLNIKQQENSIIFIKAVPVNPGNYKSGRVVQIE